MPTTGGNIAKYNSFAGIASGDVKSEFQSEYTFCKFEGTSGEEFVALELLMDWEGLNKEAHGTEPRTSPMLNPAFTHMGLSQKPHPKTINLFEVLFVKGTGNVNNMN